MPEPVDQMMNTIMNQTQGLYEPMRKFNTLMINNIEKMTEYQMDALKSYSDMGISQLKQATEVTDVDSIHDYTTNQAELMSALSQRIMKDTKAMTDMTMQFQQDFGRIFEESRGNLGEIATAVSPVQKTSSAGKTASKQ